MHIAGRILMAHWNLAEIMCDRLLRHDTRHVALTRPTGSAGFNDTVFAQQLALQEFTVLPGGALALQHAGGTQRRSRLGPHRVETAHSILPMPR
jgi:hypothetical protein